MLKVKWEFSFCLLQKYSHTRNIKEGKYQISNSLGCCFSSRLLCFLNIDDLVLSLFPEFIVMDL